MRAAKHGFGWMLVSQTEARTLRAGRVPPTIRAMARHLLETTDTLLARLAAARADNARVGRRTRVIKAAR